MKFKLVLHSRVPHALLPFNYQYPLSSALYRIIAKGDKEYAAFLHEQGYGKGFKFFSFSQINVPFKIEGDRLRLLSDEVNLSVAFHLPQAAENFVKGLFQSEQIDIADKESRASFRVTSIESIANPLSNYKEKELVHIQLTPSSPLVVGLPNEKGSYDFLAPEDKRFTDSIIYNWREKIKACYDEETADAALLMASIEPMKKTPRSRLLTIKADTPAETKIRGWMGFGLKVTGERRFVELIVNSGSGIYNSQGCGFLEVVS